MNAIKSINTTTVTKNKDTTSFIRNNGNVITGIKNIIVTQY